jgi:hypothetical protein
VAGAVGEVSFGGAKRAALVRLLDMLVYELYELAPEEITIIEGRD